MTWIWATLLLALSAPFVLWPLVRAEPPPIEPSDAPGALDDELPPGAPPGPSASE